MERKLIKQGGGGYTIYLPKKWVKKKSLKEGDLVKIKELETSLVIDSELKESNEITIDINPKNEGYLSIILSHAYRKGYDKIIINGLNHDLIKEISKVIKNILLGFEITDRTENYCKIENISEPTEQKYNAILRKIFFLMKELNSLIACDFGVYKNSEEISDVKINLDRFILFCKRILIKEKYEKDLVLEWELLTFLTHIGHSYFYAYDYSEKNKIKTNKTLLSLFEKLKNYFYLFEKAYFEEDIEKIHEINRLRNEYHFGEVLSLLKKSKGDENVLLSYIKDIFRFIQIGTSPILSKILEKNQSMSA
ncbi:MAG: hypothetical protein WC494_02195 [Candidatus Pacearchaeota archaeon]